MRRSKLLLPTAIELRDEAVALSAWSDRDLAMLEAASKDTSITRITAVPDRFTPAAGQRFLAERRDAWRRGVALSLAIHENEQGGTAGGVSLNALRPASARIGYWLVESARGRGTASRAVRLLGDWALQELGVEQIELLVEPHNAASIRVAEACGYLPAGETVDVPYGTFVPLRLRRYVRARAPREA